MKELNQEQKDALVKEVLIKEIASELTSFHAFESVKMILEGAFMDKEGDKESKAQAMAKETLANAEKERS